MSSDERVNQQQARRETAPPVDQLRSDSDNKCTQPSRNYGPPALTSESQEQPVLATTLSVDAAVVVRDAGAGRGARCLGTALLVRVVARQTVGVVGAGLQLVGAQLRQAVRILKKEPTRRTRSIHEEGDWS